MNRDIENSSEKLSLNEEDLTHKFKLSITFLIVLASLRIFNLDFLWILSDLISAAVIYFTFTSKSGLMAIFSLVNGIIGIIYALIKGFNDYKLSLNSNGIKFFYLIFLIFYSLFVYSFVTYYSYKAINIYKRDFGTPSQNAPSSNYGAISTETKSNFKAFSGKGYTLS